MKRKILFVIDSLNSGGAEKSLISLLSLLDYDKYEVDLLRFKDGGLYEPLLNENIKLIERPCVFEVMDKSLKDLINDRKYSDLIWRVKSSINIRIKLKLGNISHGAQLMWPNLNYRINTLKKEYDVAIAYSQGTPTYFVSEKVKAKKKLSWVNIDYKFAKYNKSFDERYYKNFNNIVAVSEACANVLIDVFPEYKDRIKVIYDIISENIIKDMGKSAKGFNDTYNGIRILTIGRLVYQKGYEFAIQAARILKENGVDFRWYAIGEGDLKDELEELIKKYKLEDEFILLGTFVNPYPFLRECDIYCQPSRFEGFGLAIAEARIFNKPIVATNFDIVHDQLKHEQNGVIAEMNGESVANSLMEVLINNELRGKIIDNLSKEEIDTENELKKICKLMEEGL